MIVSHGDVRNRIDQLKFSYEGYSRQLQRPGITGDRRERLEVSVRLLQEEISTLETLAQFGRIEPDRDKIEAEVRNRLQVTRDRLASNPDLTHLSAEERDSTSGQVKALLWAIGEDKLTHDTEEWLRETTPNPARLQRSLPLLLAQTVRENEDPDARASAAYDLGNLHMTDSIRALVDALTDTVPTVAEAALSALGKFSDEELQAAGIEHDLRERIAAARKA